MRQTFSCLSKLGGTTNFKYDLSLVILVLLRSQTVNTHKCDYDSFLFLIIGLKIVVAKIQKMEKMRLDEI